MADSPLLLPRVQMKEADKGKKGKRKGAVDDDEGEGGLLGAVGKGGYRPRKRK